MNIIVENREGRLGSFLCFLLMVGLGVFVILFFGEISGWIYSFPFFLIGLVPLDSFIRPESQVLGISHGILAWFKIKRGKKVDQGHINIGEIQKIISTKTSGYQLAVVDIQLQAKSGECIVLPQYLNPYVYEDKILSELIEANPSIEVERKEVQGF